GQHRRIAAIVLLSGAVGLGDPRGSHHDALDAKLLEPTVDPIAGWACLVDHVRPNLLSTNLFKRLLQRPQVARDGTKQADLTKAAAFGNRDNRRIHVDIEAHIFISVHVLALGFWIAGNNHIHADRLHSRAVTRVNGDKHTILLSCPSRSYNV